MTSPATAILQTEAKLFMREYASIFWIVFFPPILFAVLGANPAFRDPDEGIGGVSIITFYVPVGILLAMLMAGVSAMPIVLATYREQRILKRIATTPARPQHLLLAQYIVHGVAAVIGGLLTIAVAVFGYGVSLQGNPIAYILVFALVLASSLAIGGLISSVAATTKIATAVAIVCLFPLMFTAGVWLPVQAMPGLLGDIVSYTPLGAGALALADVGLGEWPQWQHLAVVVAWTAALGALAARLFRWE